MLYLTDCLLATVENISKNPIPKVQVLRNEYLRHIALGQTSVDICMKFGIPQIEYSRFAKVVNEYGGSVHKWSLKLNK